MATRCQPGECSWILVGLCSSFSSAKRFVFPLSANHVSPEVRFTSEPTSCWSIANQHYDYVVPPHGRQLFFNLGQRKGHPGSSESSMSWTTVVFKGHCSSCLKAVVWRAICNVETPARRLLPRRCHENPFQRKWHSKSLSHQVAIRTPVNPA
jgi:hypothetical protein